jgi:hypothetical protein
MMKKLIFPELLFFSGVALLSFGLFHNEPGFIFPLACIAGSLIILQGGLIILQSILSGVELNNLRISLYRVFLRSRKESLHIHCTKDQPYSLFLV